MGNHAAELFFSQSTESVVTVVYDNLFLFMVMIILGNSEEILPTSLADFNPVDGDMIAGLGFLFLPLASQLCFTFVHSCSFKLKLGTESTCLFVLVNSKCFSNYASGVIIAAVTYDAARYEILMFLCL